MKLARLAHLPIFPHPFSLLLFSAFPLDSVHGGTHRHGNLITGDWATGVMASKPAWTIYCDPVSKDRENVEKGGERKKWCTKLGPHPLRKLMLPLQQPSMANSASARARTPYPSPGLCWNFVWLDLAHDLCMLLKSLSVYSQRKFTYPRVIWAAQLKHDGVLKD